MKMDTNNDFVMEWQIRCAKQANPCCINRKFDSDDSYYCFTQRNYERLLKLMSDCPNLNSNRVELDWSDQMKLTLKLMSSMTLCNYNEQNHDVLKNTISKLEDEEIDHVIEYFSDLKMNSENKNPDVADSPTNPDDTNMGELSSGDFKESEINIVQFEYDISAPVW